MVESSDGVAISCSSCLNRIFPARHIGRHSLDDCPAFFTRYPSSSGVSVQLRVTPSHQLESQDCSELLEAKAKLSQPFPQKHYPLFVVSNHGVSVSSSRGNSGIRVFAVISSCAGYFHLVSKYYESVFSEDSSDQSRNTWLVEGTTDIQLGAGGGGLDNKSVIGEGIVLARLAGI